MKLTFENTRKEYEFLCEHFNDMGYSLEDAVSELESLNRTNGYIKYYPREMDCCNNLVDIDIYSEENNYCCITFTGNHDRISPWVESTSDQEPVGDNGCPLVYAEINITNISDYYKEESSNDDYGAFKEVVHFSSSRQ